MAAARLTKNGLIIPLEWLKKLGDDVEVKQVKGMVIIESKARAQARRRLAGVVNKLRRAGAELGAPTADEIDAEVDAVRTTRARGA